MADQVTETTVTGFMQGIMQSIKGVIVGLILFLAAFVVLWWNEGRIDVAEIARGSKHVNADTIGKANDGKLVSITGELTSEESLGDPGYLDFGPYIALNRKPEMYAWFEHKTTRTQKKLGGRKVKKVTSTYQEKWTDKPPDSDSFSEPEGHLNPTPLVMSRSYTVRQASVGPIRIDPRSARLPDPPSVSITRKNYIPSPNARMQGDYIFIGQGTIQDPKVGDLRISYSAVMSGTGVTMFGKLNGDSIEPYLYAKKGRLYRAIAGSREDAIAKMATEHKASTWILRAVGLLMMWIGLCLFFGPINAVLDFVPVLGGVGRSLVGVAMFAVALTLSLLTMLISKIAHNPLLLIGAFLVLLGGAWAFARRQRRQEEPIVKFERRKDTLPLQDIHVRNKTTSEERELAQPQGLKKAASTGKIKFACEKCGTRYTLPVSYSGRKARCKNCDHKFYVPPVSTKVVRGSTAPDSLPSKDVGEKIE